MLKPAWVISMIRPNTHAEMEQMITRGCREVDAQTKGFLYLKTAEDNSEQAQEDSFCFNADKRLDFLYNKTQI